MAEARWHWDPSTAYPSLLDDLARARFVLIGEATHGTSEFYRQRAAITRHLIDKAGILHDMGGDLVVDLDAPAAGDVLGGPRLERAIGVIYRPDTERASHYFEAHLTRQFDWLIHVDETTAVHPVDVAEEAGEELPETFPMGM